MTTRNLDALFEPKAIALIGASNQPRSVGQVLARNLFEAGFPGPVMAVNPHEQAVRSTLNYRSVAELPVVPDLAVIATPPKTVPGLIAELGQRGCRAAVVVTAGFGEGEAGAGHALQEEMLQAAEPHLMRILGPNCIGFISPAKGINASFVHLTPKAGDLAFVTQSGAIATAVLDWATARGFGFSHVLSLGDMADIDFGDLLDYLALDPATRAILLYVESVRDARKFMSAGRIAARSKPVIVIKSGRSAAGAKAALSHTGALAGADHVYDAAFRRAGMLRVFELRELFEAVATLSSGQTAAGDRLAILTNGGGAGVLATDALEEHGGRLATLSAETMAALDAVLPPTWSRANPVDLIGDASGERYGKALGAVLLDRDTDAILVMNCPTAVADSLDAAKAVVEHLRSRDRMPAFTCWLGETATLESRRLFAENRIPTYETPNEAVRAFMQLVAYRRNQDLLLEAPAAEADLPPPDRKAARAVIETVLAEKRSVLTEPEAKAVLVAYGIPTVLTRTAADPAGARRAAEEIGPPVALKILSPDISHKSDVGGVRLDLDTPEAVENAAREMLVHVGQRMPKARLAGFTVEEMVSRRGAVELLVGVAGDATFGPVILFGQGGTAAELIGDRAVGLPPLNSILAGEMMARTRIARLLGGYRDRPPVDIDAVKATLVKLSQMVVDFAEIAELDINPLIADAAGVLALDARIVVKPAAGKATARLAIQPYPAELAHRITLESGLTALVRAIRPEDKPLLLDLVARSSPEDIRLRFFAPLKTIQSGMAARLSQIDYSREMALVAVATDPDTAKDAVLGVARFIADPNFETAEYAIMVRSDQKGRGLGYELMTELIAYARSRGLKTIHGDVLRENVTMLQMAGELGFVQADTDSPEVVRVTIDLTKPVPPQPAST
jgi:acetyltransferase